jgi:hypothetical protein
MRATQVGFVSSINKSRHHPRMRVIQFYFCERKMGRPHKAGDDILFVKAE